MVDILLNNKFKTKNNKSASFRYIKNIIFIAFIINKTTKNQLYKLKKSKFITIN